MKPALTAASEEARRPITEETGRRCAAAAAEGEASPVGSCETEEIVCPHQAQEAAPSSSSEEQFGQRVKVIES